MLPQPTYIFLVYFLYVGWKSSHVKDYKNKGHVQ